MTESKLKPADIDEILAEGWVSVEMLKRHPELREILFERAAKECEEIKKLPIKRTYRKRRK